MIRCVIFLAVQFAKPPESLQSRCWWRASGGTASSERESPDARQSGVWSRQPELQQNRRCHERENAERWRYAKRRKRWQRRGRLQLPKSTLRARPSTPGLCCGRQTYRRAGKPWGAERSTVPLPQESPEGSDSSQPSVEPARLPIGTFSSRAFKHAYEESILRKLPTQLLQLFTGA